ncbi:MAG: hypothetical protein ABJC04_01775 [Verrucomicrobiota bacterium]
MGTKRKNLLIRGLFFVASPLLLFLFWDYCHMECYCFFYPGIDTRYAPDYSETTFDSVVTGMAAADVQQKLGAPLYTFTNQDGALHWGYTSDGKCILGNWCFADFAWLGREIIFRDNKVIQVYKHIYYD